MIERPGRGDIRMFRFRPPDKERPVALLARDDAIPHLHAVMVAPITSTIRGLPSQVVLDEKHGLKRRSAANPAAVATVPRSALGRSIGRLGPSEMFLVCEALRVATGCESTTAPEESWMF